MYEANWNHLQDAQRTEAVGSYYANSWGCYNMHSNVWVWVADWFDAAYPTSLVINRPVRFPENIVYEEEDPGTVRGTISALQCDFTTLHMRLEITWVSGLL